MAKPYWIRQHQGFVFNGNHRLHREEIKTINAQLGEPERIRGGKAKVDTIANSNRLPLHWLLSEGGSGAQELEHDRGLEVLQQMGELAVEAAA